MMDTKSKKWDIHILQHNILVLHDNNNNNNDNHAMVRDITPVAAGTTSFRIQPRRVLIFAIFFPI